VASRGSIIMGAKSIPGGARPTPAPQGLATAPGYGSFSPLAQELTSGGATATWGGAYQGYLPRPTETFTNGAFGPFSPILPVPVDAPAQGTEFPDPRLFQYEPGYNLPTGQPGSEGIKLCDFNTLRTLADLYSVARACIQLRKAEVRGIEWDIMPSLDAAKTMRGDRGAMKDFGSRRAEAVKFFRKPDPDYFSWNTFIDAFLEEILVFDALSLLFRQKWAKSTKKGTGKGLLGSDLDSLSLINGPTIRPLLGLHGERPRPPAPAYQQYLYGVPRCDLMTLINERDIEEGGLQGAEMNRYKADQLLYLPMTPRRWTPYGFPPIERALIPVMSGLQKQGYQLDYFREGTVPAVFVSPGGVNANMTPNQIRELQDALNAIAGDPAWKHKIIVLPADSKVDPQKSPQIADQFDEIVMNQVCVVPGTEILTKRGLVAVENIEVGDQVLTHRNRWRPVLAKFKNERGDRPVRKVSARGFDTIEVTDNHKFWSARKGQTASHKSFLKEVSWVPAEEIKAKKSRGDFDSVTMPIPELGSNDAKLDVSEWLPRSYSPKAKSLPTYICMDRQLGLLLGYYMAEGSYSRGRIVWSFHKKEADYHDVVSKAVSDIFGIDTVRRAQAGTEVVYVEAYSTALGDLFSCGTAVDKVLPEWAWDGSREFFEGLLEGWINGDGCTTSNGFRGYTASKSLAWQMRLVAAMCGHAAGIRTQKQPETSFGGRKMGGQGFIYVVQWVTDSQKPNSYKLEDGYLTSAVQANEASDYTDQVVWNLNVQEDHSYFTTGGAQMNCMAFDIQPMELGISPKVSTTVSPGASNQMAKASQSVQQRKATKPMLTFIADIMTAVLQDVCGQDDMRFVFEGLEEQEDEATKTTMLIGQVGAAFRSIDEARDELGLQPWGLPETSDPGWATVAGGWVPLTEASQARATNLVNGPLLELPPGVTPAQQQAAIPPGGAPGAAPASGGTPGPAKPAKPVTGNAGQSPGHDAAEGANATASKPGGSSSLATSAKKPAAPATGKADKRSPEGAAHQARRDSRVQATVDHVTARLTDVCASLKDGRTTVPQATDTAVALLASGYRTAMTHAAKDARADHGFRASDDSLSEDDGNEDPSDDDSVTADAATRAENQRGFLIGLLSTVLTVGMLADLANRLAMYGNTVNAAYNAAYGTTVRTEGGQDYQIRWELGAADHCRPCLDRAGKLFTFHTLPGYPGDGGFGDICAGGPNCACSLTYVQEGEDVATGTNPGRGQSIPYYQQQLADISQQREDIQQFRADDLATMPTDAAARAAARDAMRQQLADLLNARIRAGGGYQGISVEPGDITADQLEEAMLHGASKTRAVLAELEALARHLNKGRDLATWSPRHLTSMELVEVALSIKGRATPEEAVAQLRGRRIVDISGQIMWDTSPQATSLPYIPAGGGGPTLYPHDANGIPTPDDQATLKNEHGHGGGTAADVYAYLLKNYPQDVLEWVKEAHWHGPTEVPLSGIDMARRPGGARDMPEVDAMVRSIEDGTPPTHPVVLVDTPGNGKYEIADGWHRTLAFEKAKQTSIRAWIGTVTTATGPWGKTMNENKLNTDGGKIPPGTEGDDCVGH